MRVRIHSQFDAYIRYIVKDLVNQLFISFRFIALHFIRIISVLVAFSLLPFFFTFNRSSRCEIQSDAVNLEIAIGFTFFCVCVCLLSGILRSRVLKINQQIKEFDRLLLFWLKKSKGSCSWLKKKRVFWCAYLRLQCKMYRLTCQIKQASFEIKIYHQVFFLSSLFFLGRFT